MATKAKKVPPDQAARLLRAAGEKFSQALNRDPYMQQALYNWGTVLWREAELCKGEQAQRLYRSMVGKFEAAAKLKPNDFDTFFNWGTALGSWGRQSLEGDAIGLLESAESKLLEALRVRQNDDDARFNHDVVKQLLAQKRLQRMARHVEFSFVTATKTADKRS
ncbi:MAG: hypothetical protein ACOY94_07545 [Bacillota bacterium]